MLIQEEAPRPADPLATFDEDYEKAVVHLAWARHAKTNDRTLLFAMVELLPVEVPPPLDDGEQQTRLGGSSAHWVYVRRWVVPARRALDWHLSCRRGVAMMPDDSGEIASGEEVPEATLQLAQLGEVPPWPTLVCVSGESNTVPFCPPWHEFPRVHHLIPLAAFRIDELWPKESERTTAIRWLEDRLHFSLEEYPEYWGSVHLVAPNPVYRAMHTKLTSQMPPRESVLVRFQPRAGKSVEGLELTYTEKEPWGPLDVRHVTVRSPLVRLAFEREVEATREDVVDPTRGVLRASYHESEFLKDISLNVTVNASPPRLEIHAPGGYYEVNRRSRREVSPAEATPTSPSANSQLLEAQHVRKVRRAAEAQDQRWFSGKKADAMTSIRALVCVAEREILVIDPYFGPDELFDFMFAVETEEVPIQILTSSELLKQSSSLHGRRSTMGESLLAQQAHVATLENMNPVEIRVMTGKRPPIHDRFLLIDRSIWLLGSSLNEFGSRGTMMVALPDPEPVREHLLKAWNDATALRRWVEGRGNKENSSSAEET
jgi:hypothetical protein